MAELLVIAYPDHETATQAYETILTASGTPARCMIVAQAWRSPWNPAGSTFAFR